MEGNIDEGLKKVTFNTFNILSKQNEVIVLNPHRIFSKKFWVDYIKFKPEIIHHLTGPSLFSFIIIKFLTLINNHPRTIVTASHPKLKLKFLLRFLKVDLIIVHSSRTAKIFESMGFISRFIPNGVDLSKFKPATKEDKIRLRKKHSLDPDSFIMLHVGNILPERNIRILKELRNVGNVLIVGSTTIEVDTELLKDLIENGCKVWTHYIENIEEIYQLADCYIFPTENEIRAIEIPLSVLEAMSCNLPVITTKFGGLPDMFDNSDGFYFINNTDEIKNYVKIIKIEERNPNNRPKVEQLSWDDIGLELNNVYLKSMEK